MSNFFWNTQAPAGRDQSVPGAPHSSVMRNIKITIQYDGTGYSGWQVQPNALSIQEVIEGCLKKIAPDATRLVAAGRTDAGVHALEQVASFRTGVSHAPETIKKALNAMLPGDIAILDAVCCDDSFHPRFDAVRKTYVYFIHLGDRPSPFTYRYAWSLPYRLDVRKMRAAAAMLTGRHDFASFQAAGCGAKTSVRELSVLDIKMSRSISFLGFRIEGDFLTLTAEADAFLRHMVRNLAGTLVEVGRGKISPEETKKILSAKDRTLSGPTAPARGLFLKKVYY